MPRESRSGQVWSVFLGCLATVVVMLAIVTELSPAFTAQIAQRAHLDAVESELGLPSSVLLDGQGTSASGGDTAANVAHRAVDVLRDAGFAGRIDVWFTEGAEGDGKVDANDRLWAWQVTLTEERSTRLSAFTGSTGIEVRSSTTGHANPYARERVFRSTVDVGRSMHYTCESGYAISAQAASDIPDALKSEYSAAHAALRND